MSGALEVDISLGSGPCDPRTGTVDGRAWSAGEPAVGQRPGVHVAAMMGRAPERKLMLVHIQPGKLMQKGHVDPSTDNCGTNA